MIGFVAGAAVGYVLGAKAGRARYDQIVRTYRAVLDHPMVQGAAGVARAKIGEHTPLGKGKHGRQDAHPNSTQPAYQRS